MPEEFVCNPSFLKRFLAAGWFHNSDKTEGHYLNCDLYNLTHNSHFVYLLSVKLSSDF
jgi:hypothetical protein